MSLDQKHKKLIQLISDFIGVDPALLVDDCSVLSFVLYGSGQKTASRHSPFGNLRPKKHRRKWNLARTQSVEEKCDNDSFL